jgi:hypothetical protein
MEVSECHQTSSEPALLCAVHRKQFTRDLLETYLVPICAPGSYLGDHQLIGQRSSIYQIAAIRPGSFTRPPAGRHADVTAGNAWATQSAAVRAGVRPELLLLGCQHSLLSAAVPSRAHVVQSQHNAACGSTHLQLDKPCLHGMLACAPARSRQDTQPTRLTFVRSDWSPGLCSCARVAHPASELSDGAPTRSCSKITHLGCAITIRSQAQTH